MSTDASHGLDLPAPLGVGYPDPNLREQWLDVVGLLMARGIRSVAEMRRSLARANYTPTYETVRGWMKTVKSRYSEGLSRPEIEEGRGLLLAEMEQVSSVAWNAVFQILNNGVEVPIAGGDTTVVGGLERIAPLLAQITAANKQKATLYGLDRIKVDVRRVNAELDVAKIVEVAAKAGIPAEALRGLGSQIAQLISTGG